MCLSRNRPDLCKRRVRDAAGALGGDTGELAANTMVAAELLVADAVGQQLISAGRSEAGTAMTALFGPAARLDDQPSQALP